MKQFLATLFYILVSSFWGLAGSYLVLVIIAQAYDKWLDFQNDGSCLNECAENQTAVIFFLIGLVSPITFLIFTFLTYRGIARLRKSNQVAPK